MSTPLPSLPALPFDSTAPQVALLGEPARVHLARVGIKVEFVADSTAAACVVESIITDDLPIGLDIETAKLAQYAEHPDAGLDPHMSEIRLLQLYPGGSTAYVFDVRSVGLTTLAPIWSQPLVAHNAVFEVKHLLHAGIQPDHVDCTMLIANALDGRLPALQELARTELGWEISKAQQASDWNTTELTVEQIEYAALDAVLVRLLAQRLRARLQELDRLRIYGLMRGAQLAIAEMELAGLHFNRGHHTELMRTWADAKEKAEHELVALLGSEMNPASHVQLGRWLEERLDEVTRSIWPRTDRGVLRSDGETLKVHADHRLVRPLVAFKDATKRLSGFGERYAAHVSPATGRIHASFRLGGSVAGRMSCQGPNLQNAPRDPEFRSLFIAPPDRMLVVADYSQIELRVAALVSGDRRMLDAYVAGDDLHRATAAAILGVEPAAVTKDQRQAAKAVNFGLLFGQGAKGLIRYAAGNYGVTMSIDDAERARRVFFETYRGLAEWQRRTGQAGRREGQVRTPAGRIRRLSYGRYGYSVNEALNSPIQGGAAEVLLAALGVLPQRLARLDAALVNVVHDEVIVEAAVADTRQAKEAVESAMVEGMLTIFPTASVNGLVEAAIVENWAEAK